MGCMNRKDGNRVVAGDVELSRLGGGASPYGDFLGANAENFVLCRSG